MSYWILNNSRGTANGLYSSLQEFYDTCIEYNISRVVREERKHLMDEFGKYSAIGNGLVVQIDFSRDEWFNINCDIFSSPTTLTSNLGQNDSDTIAIDGTVFVGGPELPFPGYVRLINPLNPAQYEIIHYNTVQGTVSDPVIYLKTLKRAIFRTSTYLGPYSYSIGDQITILLGGFDEYVNTFDPSPPNNQLVILNSVLTPATPKGWMLKSFND